MGRRIREDARAPAAVPGRKGREVSVAKSSKKNTPAKSAATAKKPKSSPSLSSAPVGRKAPITAKSAPVKAVAGKPGPIKNVKKGGNTLAIKATPASVSRERGPRPVPVGSIGAVDSRRMPVAGRDGGARPQPQGIIEAPNRTDSKPRKNQAGLSSRELEHFREQLLAKRRELVGDMSSMEHEALRSSGGTNLSNLPIHMADMGTDNYEQEFTLGLVEKDRELLREINIALGKIQNGSYGICEGTGKPINKPRLEAQPWAKYSIEYARQLEKNRGLR